MPFASGTFTLAAGNPVTTNTTISSTWANNTLNDIASGLSTCVLKDGTQTITGNLPMSSFKLTGLGAGSANGDSVRYEQVFTTTTGALTLLGSLFVPATVSTSGAINMVQAANITATATIALGAATGNYAVVTGTATVSSFDSIRAGALRVIEWSGATPLSNSSNLILPGNADLTTATGDLSIAISDGGGTWRMMHQKRSGAGLGPALSTTQNLSGTTIDFTIPAWAKLVYIEIVEGSSNGTSDWIIQLGDPTVETAGYVGMVRELPNLTGANFSSGFNFSSAITAGDLRSGLVTLALVTPSTFTWAMSGNVAEYTANSLMEVSAGSKSTTAAVSVIRITTVNGTDAYDAGTVNLTVL